MQGREAVWGFQKKKKKEEQGVAFELNLKVHSYLNM